MKITRKVMREVEEHEYTCDRCGDSLTVVVGGHPETRGLVAHESGGYAQTFPPDTESWQFALCEPCLGWLATQMKRYPFMRSSTDLCEVTKKAIETGDFSDLMTQSYGAIAATRALARMQPTEDAFKAIDRLADEHERLSQTAHDHVRDMWCETVAVCQQIVEPDDAPENASELVSAARKRLPNLAAALLTARHCLGFIVGSCADENARDAARDALKEIDSIAGPDPYRTEQE